MQNQLPKEIRDLITSPLIYEKVEKIGEKYNLNLDQIGELDAETRAILAGYTKSEDYIKDIINRLEISRDIAQQIADEVGTEVFTNLRTAMREMQEKKDVAMNTAAAQGRDAKQNKTIAQFEREGNLNVYKEAETLENPINITRGSGNADLIINQIENPETANTAPVNILDRMLAGPTSQSTKTETLKAPVPQQTSASSVSTPPKSRPYSKDPYREPVI